MSNPTVEYNNYVRANLPGYITYDSTRNQYVTGNGKRFYTYKEAKWYCDYLIKFGSNLGYSVAGFTPPMVSDFINNKFFVGGVPKSFSETYEHTATTNGTMTDSDGLLKWRPHNLLSDSVGLTTNWATSSQGTGSLPTITRDYATAPDGTMTAARLQCSRTSSGSGDRSYFFQNMSTVIGSTLKQALWVKSTDGTSQTIQLQNQQENNAKLTETVGSSWQRINLEYPVLLSTTGKFWIGLVGAETTDLTTDVLIWHPHLHRSDLGGMASDPDQAAGFETEVPTTGSSAVYLPRRGHHIYNGSAWVNAGVLIEPETRTNIFERSSPTSISYNGNSGVASPTLSQTNPFTGEGDAALITASAGAGSHYAASNAHFSTPSGASSITTTVWVERGTSRYVFFEVYGPGPAYEAACVVDLDTLSVTTLVVADVAFYATEVANDVYALSIADNTNGNVGTPYVRVGPHDGTSSATWTASGNETVKLLAVQVEEGPTPSSFTPTYNSQVSRAGEQLVLPHENISWPSGDELSIHIQGRMTGQNSEFVRWRLDASNYISLSSGSGDFTFSQSEGGTVDSVTGGSFTSGTNVSFNIASRNGSTFINGAVDGAALTANTTPTTFPDLETTNLQLAYSGGSMVIKEVSLWDVNITDAGTEDATS